MFLPQPGSVQAWFNGLSINLGVRGAVIGSGLVFGGLLLDVVDD